MRVYVVVLFVHITGALGYFISAGARLFDLAVLRRARRVEQVRIIMTLDDWLGPLFGLSLLTLIVTGLYMARKDWGFQTGWIDVALVSVVLIAPLGAALMEPRRRAIVRATRETADGPIPEALARRINDPILQASARALPVLLLGIVFLMATKPSSTVSILTMVVAAVLGTALGILEAFRFTHQKESAVTPTEEARG